MPAKFRKLKRWQFSEKFWADLLHAKRQPGSGNQPGAPGDMRLQQIHFEFDDACLLESKQTSAYSMTLREDILKKISDEALALGRVPLLGLEINKQKWLAIPAWTVMIRTEKEDSDVTT
jgi:hypothetical protein